MISVNTQSELAAWPTNGVALGTYGYVVFDDLYFYLETGTETAVPDQIIVPLDVDGVRWKVHASATSVVQSVTGSGVNNTDPANPVINTASYISSNQSTVLTALGQDSFSATQGSDGANLDVAVTTGLFGVYRFEFQGTLAAGVQNLLFRINGSAMTSPDYVYLQSSGQISSPNVSTNNAALGIASTFSAVGSIAGITKATCFGTIAVRNGLVCGSVGQGMVSDGTAHVQCNASGFYTAPGTLTSIGMSGNTNIKSGSILRLTRIGS